MDSLSSRGTSLNPKSATLDVPDRSFVMTNGVCLYTLNLDIVRERFFTEDMIIVDVS
jgi:hypothetical protein